jgi:4'-phosphopantetheinyl transferase
MSTPEISVSTPAASTSPVSTLPVSMPGARLGGNLPASQLPIPDPSGRTAIAFSCSVAENLELYNLSVPFLSPDEQARAARFSFDRDRCVYAAAHLLLRRCLHRATGRMDWSFRRNAFGKPQLVESFDGLPLRFNLTHTAGLAACALVYGHEVGIDAEALDRRGDHLDLARQFFTADEVEVLTRSPSTAREETFLAIWTAKEAVIKAAGQGLQMSLDTFSVDISAPRVTFHDSGREESGREDNGKWTLHRHRLPGHHLALAIRTAPGISPPERVDWHQTDWADLLTA